MTIRKRMQATLPPDEPGEAAVTLTPASKAQAQYKVRQVERGYIHTRVWLPAELKGWHDIVARRARDWKEHGVPLVLPPLPTEVSGGN